MASPQWQSVILLGTIVAITFFPYLADAEGRRSPTYQSTYGDKCVRVNDCNFIQRLVCGRKTRTCVCMYTNAEWDSENNVCNDPEEDFYTNLPTRRPRPKTTLKPGPGPGPWRKTTKRPGPGPGPWRKTTKRPGPGPGPGRKTTKRPGPGPGRRSTKGPGPGPGPWRKTTKRPGPGPGRKTSKRPEFTDVTGFTEEETNETTTMECCPCP